MQIQKFTVQACCGKTSITYKIDRSVNLELLQSLVKIGFIENQHFTKVGILYCENINFIITTPLGSDRLQIKCKKKDCVEKLNDLEYLLQQL